MSNSSEKPARSERRKRNHVGLDKGKGKARDGDGVTVLNDDNDNQRDAIPSYAPSKAQFKKYIRGADVKTASVGQAGFCCGYGTELSHCVLTLLMSPPAKQETCLPPFIPCRDAAKFRNGSLRA